jgi:cysteine desulfurase
MDGRMIYLDYNATTPIASEVAAAMIPYLFGHFGNPSSSHALGREAKADVDRARGQVASLVGCSLSEIVFTSGGSESDNMAIKGVAFWKLNRKRRIVTSVIEHLAVLMPCRYLESMGFDVRYVSVDRQGTVDMEALEREINEDTLLVTIMHANNETGTLQPLHEISAICRKQGALLHTDASQSVGKVPVSVEALGVDLLTIAGHKLYAPKGIGALYIRDGIELEPLIHGAGHEGGRRAGTENVLLDVALGAACALAEKHLQDANDSLTRYFLHELGARFRDQIILNGHPEKRLPNTLNVSFLGHDSHDLLRKLSNVAASTGSACHSGQTTISPVLSAMGVSEQAGRGAIRFSLGRYTTRDEIDEVLQSLGCIIGDQNKGGEGI